MMFYYYIQVVCSFFRLNLYYVIGIFDTGSTTKIYHYREFNFDLLTVMYSPKII